jgi:protein ImuB
LFDPPQPIEVTAEVPDGPPRRFRWRGDLHDVARFEGPERIAPEWWRDDSGAAAPPRDYYRIEDTRGRRFWVFRQGLYGAGGAPHPGWYLHGLFA